MRLVAAVTAAFTFAVPARLHSQQHQPPPSATVVRDTLTGIVVAIDTMKATGMMGSMPMAGREHAQAMKHDMGGTKPDSGGMKHDMGPMNHAEHHKMMTQGGGGLALRILAGHDTISAHLGPVW